MSDDSLRIVDLFAGAGGLSTGIAYACEDAGLTPSEDVELHAVNHWQPAIETHEENYPWAQHYHAKIEELHPPNVVEPGTVDLLAGGPECTHFSTARGGKPVSEQKRASAWHVLDWVEKLQPTHILLENVSEFRDWGPIKNGTPTRDGSIFERWVGILEALGYSVVYDEDDENYGVVLNASEYGDPQSRERLFIMASRECRPTAPEPTHDDADPDKPDRRTAADIIEWSDLGTSIWTRDLQNPLVQPLSQTTMGRIAEGIRRHCDERLAPLADALETIDADRLQSLRERVVPARYAQFVAQVLDEPFLVHTTPLQAALRTPSVVKYYGTSTVTPVSRPLDTVTADGNHHGLSTPTSVLLGQHSNSVARDVNERPAPTVATGGKLQLATAETFCLRQQSGGVPVPVDEPLSTVTGAGAIGMATASARSLIKPRNGVNGDDHSNPLYPPASRPVHVVTAQNHDGHLVTPTLIHYSHGGALNGLDAPLPTIATERGGAFALSQPYLCPLYNGRTGQRPRTREVDRPLSTVPASKSPAGLATPVVAPFIDDYEGAPEPLDEPLGTCTSRDRFALVVPEYWPWGLDVRYRMLQPDELKQAQGFPPDYTITGDRKKDRTAQIGNAVPVHLAQALVRHLFSNQTPSLSTFGAGITGEPEADVPDYSEVNDD